MSEPGSGQIISIGNALTASEARRLVEEIKSGVLAVGEKLLELYEREGWRALGCKNWRECVTAEFHFSQSRAYQLLNQATIERNLGFSTIVEKASGSLPESHARELAPLEPEEQRQVWQAAVETAPEGKVTAAHIRETREAIKPHVAHNSGNNEWYTPKEYIDAARSVMGHIDLDPASSPTANDVVDASAFHTSEDDGLTKEWAGRIWMNPPYAGELIGKFAAKLCEDFKSGAVSEAIVLVNNATETGWFQEMAALASMICFPKGRVKFWHPTKESTPLQGQALLYLGKNGDRFRDAFQEFGLITVVI